MIVTDKTSLLEFANANFHGDIRWRDPSRCTAIGWSRGGKIRAAVVYDQFYWPSISGHIVSDRSKRWASKEFVRAMFEYPFRQLECVRVTAPVDYWNDPAIRFLEHLGFQLEGRLRKALPDGGDRLIYGILKEDCKWLS